MLASLTGTAVAEMVPEDPYKDVEPTKVELLKAEVDATSGVGKVIKSGVAAAGSASTPTTFASTNVASEEVGEEWWEQQEVQIGGGVGIGLLVLGLMIRGRRNARRRRQLLADRRTQFGMSAVDPRLAGLNVAAWERGPAIMPTAIEPEMVRPSRPGSAPFVIEQVAPSAQPLVAPSSQPYAAAPVAPSAQPFPAVPNVAQPLPSLATAQSVRPATPAYRHYSEADLAAYGMRPSQQEVAPVATIAPPSAPMPARQGSQPALVIPPHAALQAAQVQQQLAQHAERVSRPDAQAYQVAQPVEPLPSLPQQPNQAPRGSWHPTVLPWDQVSPPHHAPAIAPFVGQQAPHHAPALQAFMAPAPNARRARLAEGTPQPPIANPQPFVALPHALPQPPVAPHPHSFAPPVATYAMPTVASHLAQTRLAQDASATTHFAPAPAMHLGSAPARPPAPQPYAAMQYASAPAMQAPLPPMPFPPVGTPVAVPLQPELARVGGPQSFVLENSSARLPQMPATYPLTFPAFPEAAGAVMLAPIEPSGLNYWGPPTTEVDGESILFSQLAEPEPQLARGSQPVEHLEAVRVALPQATTPDAETRIAPAPLDKRTFEMHRRR